MLTKTTKLMFLVRDSGPLKLLMPGSQEVRMQVIEVSSLQDHPDAESQRLPVGWFELGPNTL